MLGDMRAIADGAGANLIDELRRLDLRSTEASLDRCVAEEAEDLLLIHPGERKTAARRRTCEALAMEAYVRQIEAFINDPEYQLTPEDILHYRTKANSWAIAQIIIRTRKEGE